MKPPRIVYSSEEANFSLYTSWSESTTVNRRTDPSIDVPTPAIDSSSKHASGNNRSRQETLKDFAFDIIKHQNLKQKRMRDFRMRLITFETQ